ncbi:hypothetical protein AC629_13400 [Bradyrhizobium sp. NAS80.1]|nr:hypothetical protein AC629_13400 [Bradyrhizobium sp. NAS80.1]
MKELAVLSATRTGAFSEPNTSLFRYVGMRDARAWEFLEYTVLQHKIPLTTSVSFNDPFDSNPVVVSDISFEEIGKALDGLPFNSPILSMSGKVVDEAGQPISNADLEKRVVDLLSESFVRMNSPRVASFCRRISSQLLWAHYANSYRGLAYHFVTSGSPESSLTTLVRPVKYERQRPIILVSEILDILHQVGKETPGTLYQLRASFERKAYLTKSIEWAYEEEERLLLKDSEARFEPHELAAIIVGPHFSDDHFARLKAIIAKRSRRLRIYRARLADSDYAIEIDWANPFSA